MSEVKMARNIAGVDIATCNQESRDTRDQRPLCNQTADLRSNRPKVFMTGNRVYAGKLKDLKRYDNS